MLDRRWSTTHGFFIIMGGFHLFERSSEETSNDDRCISQEHKPLHPLGVTDLLRHSESFIMPAEAELKDKGKSDWLAKSLVLLQTTWFVMQCIARAIEHLPVTHLNCHARVCGHEFRDIYLLVEQTTQCQSACPSVPKV